MNKGLILLLLTLPLSSASVIAENNNTSKYTEYKKLQKQKYKQFKSDYLGKYEKYRTEIKEKWGVAELSSPTEYVHYSADKNIKVIADFESDFIEISIQHPNNNSNDIDNFSNDIENILDSEIHQAVLESLNFQPATPTFVIPTFTQDKIEQHAASLAYSPAISGPSHSVKAKQALKLEQSKVLQAETLVKVTTQQLTPPPSLTENELVKSHRQIAPEKTALISKLSVLGLLGIESPAQLKSMIEKAEHVPSDIQLQRVVARTDARLEKQIIALDNFATSDAPVKQIQTSQQLIKSMDNERKSLSKIAQSPKDKNTTTYRLSLKRNRSHKAEPYLDSVNHYSKEWGVTVPMILAVMETESSFNPMAESHIPAYGLMQIVPSTAGLDVNQKLLGLTRKPQPKLLFSSAENIKYGSAYIHILMTRYLKEVKDPKSRFYCAIAAYNTGIGNLAKAFNKGKKGRIKAISVINQMTPDEVYKVIKKRTHTETQRYLDKVLKSHQYFSEQRA
jgi:membrane-bound lytic murein transglycosylase C